MEILLIHLDIKEIIDGQFKTHKDVNFLNARTKQILDEAKAGCQLNKNNVRSKKHENTIAGLSAIAEAQLLLIH